MKLYTTNKITNVSIILIAMLYLSLTIVSCSKENASVTSSSSSSDSSGSDSSSGDSSSGGTDSDSSSSDSSSESSVDCTADGVGDQSNSYYNLNVIAHGNGGGGEVWSTQSDSSFQSEDAQNIFMTDSRFNVRILAFSSPGKSPSYVPSKECLQDPLNYTKLKLKVGIKAQGSSTYYSTHIFEDIPVDSCSEVHEFSVPPTSEPLVMTVMDVEFDWTCQQYVNMGYDADAPEVSSYCPYWSVPALDCFEIGIQFSTDYTRDIPH